jgi:cyclic AMP-dependent transcription factor ATF-4
LAKGSVKDKGLRKKEQNKTAATRYRQKKKIEFSLILETEAELQQEHDDLEKKRDNLDREIKMVKQLLRDVIQSKKPTSNNNKAKKSIILESVGLTVSTSTNLIGRNRRK